MEISIVIDSLTNCLVDSITGEEFDTEFKEIAVDSSMSKNLKNQGWRFDWSIPAREGYKLIALFIKNSDDIQGIIAIKHLSKEMFTHVTLVESAPFNVGSKGKYKGVGGHLFAIACKLSWEAGNEGYVQFTSKTDLVDHYITTLGAKHIDSRTLYIDSYNALVLIKKYIKEI